MTDIDLETSDIFVIWKGVQQGGNCIEVAMMGMPFERFVHCDTSGWNPRYVLSFCSSLVM